MIKLLNNVRDAKMLGKNLEIFLKPEMKEHALCYQKDIEEISKVEKLVSKIRNVSNELAVARAENQ